MKKVRKEPRVVFLSSFNVTHLPFSVEMKLRKNQRYDLVLFFSFIIPDFWFTNIEITYEYKKMAMNYT